MALTFSGSLLRQASTNSLNCLLKFPVNCGGLFLGIKNKTLIGCRSEFGGSPFANSMAVIPKLHMSACLFDTYQKILLEPNIIEERKREENRGKEERE